MRRKLGELPPEGAESVERFREHMKACQGDLTLIILKGHLLIEEQLIGLIEDKLNYGGLLWDGDFRLGFKQKVDLAKKVMSSSNLPVIRWTFHSIGQLNDMRNSLAHHLVNHDLDNQIKQFLGGLEKHPRFKVPARGKLTLRNGIAILYQTLILFRHLAPEDCGLV